MRKFIIGVTGVSGSGKTTVTGILEKCGAYAVIADELAHEALLRVSPAFGQVAEAFGAEILNEDGEIDRKKLGALVFGNRERLYILEGIIHPYVRNKTNALIAAAMKTGEYRAAVIDAPMLFEAGMHEDCNAVWLITAPDEMKIARIMKRDSINREAAEKRLATRNEKVLSDLADEVIINAGTQEELERNVLEVWERLQ